MEHFILLDPKTNLWVDIKDKEITPELVESLKVRYRITDTPKVDSLDSIINEGDLTELSEEEIF